MPTQVLCVPTEYIPWASSPYKKSHWKSSDGFRDIFTWSLWRHGCQGARAFVVVLACLLGPADAVDLHVVTTSAKPIRVFWAAAHPAHILVPDAQPIREICAATNQNPRLRFFRRSIIFVIMYFWSVCGFVCVFRTGSYQ